MSQRSLNRIAQGARRWLRRSGLALHLIGCCAAVFAATFWVGLENGGNLIWLANGILLAYLLLAPRNRWPLYLIAGFIGELTGGILIDSDHGSKFLVLAALNICESALAAFLLRSKNRDLPQFTDRKYLLRFLLCGVLLAPLAVGSVFAVTLALWIKLSPWQGILNWLTTDGLGIAIATPACVAVFRTRFRDAGDWKSNWVLPVVLVLVTFAAFSQSKIPFVFLVYPVMAVILLRFGLGWAALGTLFITTVSGWYTLRGVGPFTRIDWFQPAGPSILVQLYIASGIFMIYAVSTVLDQQRATEHKLQEIVALHELVTENSRDIIILADFKGQRSFVSSAAARWDMWTQEEILHHASFDLVHPDDRCIILPVLQEIRLGGEGAVVECRVRKRDGEYIWVEASLRPVRDPKTGAAVGILNMVRDIRKRKAAEEELHDAYHALEALAVTDGLTHLANRRRFDQFLSTEWRRCLREKLPLSLLLIDVDLFKSYNDTYGHLRGDCCLKQIAESAQDAAGRPCDLVARFGGEEFAIVLPNTDSAGAHTVAEQVTLALGSRNLEHRGSPLGMVTVSIGYATMVPGLGQHAATLIQRADDAMYAAKGSGRNRICCDDDLHQNILTSQAS